MKGKWHQRGFSLAELAIALAALGLVTWAVAGAYGNAGAQHDRDAARVHGQQMLEAVKAFALVNARLPCPDTDGDGWEGGASGCPSGAETGWFPYRSLGLDLPEPALRAAYGVYRNVAADADLAVRSERSTPADAADDPGYQDVRDLIIGLSHAAAQAPAAGHVYLTGDDGTQGAVDCTNNVRSHPAVVLAMPLSDRDNDGSRFDGVHPASPASAQCFQAPGTAGTVVRDDVVVAESLLSLAGWLAAHAP